MNKNHALLLAVAIVTAPAFAHAELIINGSLKGTMVVGTTSAEAKVEAGTENQPQAGTKAENRPSSSVSPKLESGFLDISVHGSEIRKAGGTSFNVSNAAEVRTDADLKEYAEAKAHEEVSIDSIDIGESEVSVTWSREAKLLGFIPFFVNEKAKVKMESDGKAVVSVKGSWWAFVSKLEMKSEALAAEIRTRTGSTVANSLDASLSASAKARILSGILASSEATYSVAAK